MAYSKQTWIDGASGGTPVSAARLNKIEDGIAAAVPNARISDGGLFVSPTGSDTANDGLSLGAPLRTITAAIAKLNAAGVGGEISLAPGEHPYGATDGTDGGSTIRLLPGGLHLHGSTSGGTIIRRTVDDGKPMFDSDPAQPLWGTVIEDLEIRTNLNVQPTYDGTSHGFKLYCFTNNSAIRRIGGQRLRGDVVNISPNLVTGDLGHGMFNCEVAQVFGVACGGHVVRTSGRPTGVIHMPDGTNMRGGLLHLSDGIGNQAALLVTQPMWEGGTNAVSLQPVTMDNMGNQAVVFTSGSFQGAAGSTDAFRITGQSANPILVGCSGYNFTNWVNNLATGAVVPMSDRLTYYGTGIDADTVSAHGAGANLEVYNTASTANRRRWRWSVSSGILVLSQRNDDGTSVQDIAYANGADGRFEVANDLRVDGRVGFYNTPPVAKPAVTGAKGANAALTSLIAALVSQGLITDTTT